MVQLDKYPYTSELSDISPRHLSSPFVQTVIENAKLTAPSADLIEPCIQAAARLEVDHLMTTAALTKGLIHRWREIDHPVIS